MPARGAAVPLPSSKLTQIVQALFGPSLTS
jgi:hypothetical protein